MEVLVRGPVYALVGAVVGGALAIPLLALTPIILPVWAFTGAILLMQGAGEGCRNGEDPSE